MLKVKALKLNPQFLDLCCAIYVDFLLVVVVVFLGPYPWDMEVPRPAQGHLLVIVSLAEKQPS